MNSEQLKSEARKMIMASVRNWDDGTINNPELEQNIMEELNTLVTTTYNAGLEKSVEVVQNRINELLEEGGFNDVFVDKQLKHLVTQHADPRVQLAAISEYNKLMSRIEEKKTIRHTFADDDTPEEELDRIIEEQEKHFNKT